MNGTNKQSADVTPAAATPSYEPPALVEIGAADDVILGTPGCGLDGPDGMSETAFEFEPDDVA